VPPARPRHRLYSQVATRANHRCEYCLAPEELSGKEFQVEHIVPLASGGTDELNNLALACFRCNLSKGTAQAVQLRQGDQPVRLFNPRTDDWNECFDFVLAPDNEAVRIVAKNDTSRATAAGCA
jgi:5-methylcytosine-specific restriction endonuclease McrA